MISFFNKITEKTPTLAFFSDDKLNIGHLKKSISSDLYLKISNFLKKNKPDIKRKIHVFNISDELKCYLIICNVKQSKIFEINSLGANFKQTINPEKNIKSLNLIGNLDFISDKKKSSNFLLEFLLQIQKSSFPSPALFSPLPAFPELFLSSTYPGNGCNKSQPYGFQIFYCKQVQDCNMCLIDWELAFQHV